MKTQRLKDAKASGMLQPVVEPRFELRPNLTISNLLLYHAAIKENSQEKEALPKQTLLGNTSESNQEPQ